MKRFFLLFPLIPVILVFTFLWSLPAFLNDSPFYYYDSGFFITVSKDSILWRPAFYGYLIKPFVNPTGLMSVVFVQNFLAVLVVSRFILVCFQLLDSKRAVREDKTATNTQSSTIQPGWETKKTSPKKTIFIGFVLTALFLTPLVHCTNFIMTDFMTGLGFLTSLMFFSIKTRERYFWLFLTFVFTIIHYTHLFTFLPVFLVKLPLKYRKRLFAGLALGAVFLYFQFIFAKPKTGFGKALHYTVFSRIMAYGKLRPLLKDHCQQTRSPFCKSKRMLKFHVWKNNPRFIIDKEHGYIKLFPEIVKLNQSFFKDLYSVLLFLRESLKAFFRQVVLFSTPLEIVAEDHFIAKSLRLHSRKSFEKYFNTEIFNDKKSKLRQFQKGQGWFFLVLTILSFSFMVFQKLKKKLSREMESDFFLLNLCYLTHSFFCALFTDPTPRYNNRLVWLYVLLSLICLTQAWRRREKERETPVLKSSG